MLFKRKSVRKFDPDLSVSQEEMQQIAQKLPSLAALAATMPVKFRLVERSKTTCRWGEHCLLCYSKQTEHAWLNAGYMLEQMDLFLASLDIGVCWYGLSKPDTKTHEGLPYLIMLAFGKSRPNDFRTDIAQASRQPRDVIWQGDGNETIANAARFSTPSMSASFCVSWKSR